MSWTDERVATLVKLNADCRSCSEIARELGGTTRNAVIGKLSRMGLKGQGNAGRKYAGGRKPYVPKERKAKSASYNYIRKPNIGNRSEREHQAEQFAALFATETTADLTPEQRARTVTLLKLTDKTCKWPLGHPGKADFCFCGDKPVDDKPYCAPHWRLGHERAVRRA